MTYKLYQILNSQKINEIDIENETAEVNYNIGYSTCDIEDIVAYSMIKVSQKIIFLKKNKDNKYDLQILDDNLMSHTYITDISKHLYDIAGSYQSQFSQTKTWNYFSAGIDDNTCIFFSYSQYENIILKYNIETDTVLFVKKITPSSNWSFNSSFFKYTKEIDTMFFLEKYNNDSRNVRVHMYQINAERDSSISLVYDSNLNDIIYLDDSDELLVYQKYNTYDTLKISKLTATYTGEYYNYSGNLSEDLNVAEDIDGCYNYFNGQEIKYMKQIFRSNMDSNKIIHMMPSGIVIHDLFNNTIKRVSSNPLNGIEYVTSSICNFDFIQTANDHFVSPSSGREFTLNVNNTDIVDVSSMTNYVSSYSGLEPNISKYGWDKIGRYGYIDVDTMRHYYITAEDAICYYIGAIDYNTKDFINIKILPSLKSLGYTSLGCDGYMKHYMYIKRYHNSLCLSRHNPNGIGVYKTIATGTIQIREMLQSDKYLSGSSYASIVQTDHTYMSVNLYKNDNGNIELFHNGGVTFNGPVLNSTAAAGYTYTLEPVLLTDLRRVSNYCVIMQKFKRDSDSYCKLKFYVYSYEDIFSDTPTIDANGRIVVDPVKIITPTTYYVGFYKFNIAFIGKDTLIISHHTKIDETTTYTHTWYGSDDTLLTNKTHINNIIGCPEIISASLDGSIQLMVSFYYTPGYSDYVTVAKLLKINSVDSKIIKCLNIISETTPTAQGKKMGYTKISQDGKYLLKIYPERTSTSVVDIDVYTINTDIDLAIDFIKTFSFTCDDLKPNNLNQYQMGGNWYGSKAVTHDSFFNTDMIYIDFFVLLRDNDNNYYKYNAETQQKEILTLAGETPNLQEFLDNGVSLEVILTAPIDVLSNITLIKYADTAVPYLAYTLDYEPEAVLVSATDDITWNPSTIENIDSFVLSASESGSGILRVILSLDSGITWKSYDGSSLVGVNYTKEDALNNGLTIAEFNSLPSVVLEEIRINGKVRFAYYLDRDTPAGITETDILSLTVDYRGDFVGPSTSSYQYKIRYDEVEIEILQAGDFKVDIIE